MSYLLDKKIKRQKVFYGIFFVVILLISFYFRFSIFNGLSTLSHFVFRPVLILGNNVGGTFESFGSYFASKKSLSLENESLRSELKENNARVSNYDSILMENTELKEILGRKSEKDNWILSAILAKPNQSPYDTLVIDIGEDKGLKSGDIVFAFGNIPIGRVDTVYKTSSKVVLFSNSGEKTRVVTSEKNIFLEIVGRGGGNFEMILPRDFTEEKGDEVFLPGINPYVLAKVESIISDRRDPFIKALLTSPANIQELRFVEVALQK